MFERRKSNIPLPPEKLSMEIRQARFLTGSTDARKLPEPKFPEFAFIGRSNVGKSSLINRLCGRKDLAKISQKPGKTQQINHFVINEQWYLVDLPGYGYAKVSKTEREKWGKFIRHYFQSRMNLQCAFVLLDSRIPPQAIDLEFINSLGEWGVPFVLVYTKVDKLGMNPAQKNASAFHREMKKTWDEIPPTFFTSAESGYGKDALLQFILSLTDGFVPPDPTEQGQ